VTFVGFCFLGGFNGDHGSQRKKVRGEVAAVTNHGWHSAEVAAGIKAQRLRHERTGAAVFGEWLTEH